MSQRSGDVPESRLVDRYGTYVVLVCVCRPYKKRALRQLLLIELKKHNFFVLSQRFFYDTIKFCARQAAPMELNGCAQCAGGPYTCSWCMTQEDLARDHSYALLLECSSLCQNKEYCSNVWYGVPRTYEALRPSNGLIMWLSPNFLILYEVALVTLF